MRTAVDVVYATCLNIEDERWGKKKPGCEGISFAFFSFSAFLESGEGRR